MSYLANTIRTQMDLSNRLAAAQLTLGGGESAEGQQRGGQRGGKGGGRGQQRTQERGGEEVHA